MTATPEAEPTSDQLEALAMARRLVAAGVPLFVAPPDPAHPTGFRLPASWQTSTPDPGGGGPVAPGLGVVRGDGSRPGPDRHRPAQRR